MERIVDLGPFKHKASVDDGEPLRKAALSCIDTILDSLPNKLDVATLMPYLAKVIGNDTHIQGFPIGIVVDLKSR
ncbi:unnamed protein product, partial [Laminaria digitata]